MKKKIKNIMKMMKIKKLYQKVGMLIFNKILIKNMLNNKKKKINKLNQNNNKKKKPKKLQLKNQHKNKKINQKLKKNLFIKKIMILFLQLKHQNLQQ